MQVTIKHIENPVFQETCITHDILIYYSERREDIIPIWDLSTAIPLHFKSWKLSLWTTLIVTEKIYSEAGKCPN